MRRRLLAAFTAAACLAVCVLGVRAYSAFAAGSAGAIVEAVVPTEDIHAGVIGEGTIFVVTGKQAPTGFAADCFSIPGNPTIEFIDSVAINPGDGARRSSLVVPDLNECCKEYRAGTRFSVVSIGLDTCNFEAEGGAIDIDLTHVTLQEI